MMVTIRCNWSPRGYRAEVYADGAGEALHMIGGGQVRRVCRRALEWADRMGYEVQNRAAIERKVAVKLATVGGLTLAEKVFAK